MGARAETDNDLAALFGCPAYGPTPVAKKEPRATGGVLPEWVKPLFSPLVAENEYPALLERAPLDIRVNRLIADREAVANDLQEANLLPESRDGLRLPTGFSIESNELYTSGAIEVQDFGSQWIAEACNAAPGMTVLALCAGAGGKTLALASHMAGQGRLVAADTNRDRLSQLPPRAARAKAGFIETLLLNPNKEKAALDDLAVACDVVLIDAPCSGSGTWRRNPETRGRLDQRNLQRLALEQARLLDLASGKGKQVGHRV